MAYIVMAYIVMAYMVMVYIVMAYVVMAYIVMAMAYIVMAYVVMAYIVMGVGVCGLTTVGCEEHCVDLTAAGCVIIVDELNGTANHVANDCSQPHTLFLTSACATGNVPQTIQWVCVDSRMIVPSNCAATAQRLCNDRAMTVHRREQQTVSTQSIHIAMGAVCASLHPGMVRRDREPP